MGTQFWVVQAFNGVSYGALLFLVGSGLSLIFGVMRIVNLSHGSYFLLGGYIALSVIHATGSWALSLPVAALAVAVLGLLMERLFLRSQGFEIFRNAVRSLERENIAAKFLAAVVAQMAPLADKTLSPFASDRSTNSAADRLRFTRSEVARSFSRLSSGSICCFMKSPIMS